MALNDKLVLVDASSGTNTNVEFSTIGVAGQNNQSLRRTTPFDAASYSELLLVQGAPSNSGIRTVSLGLKVFRTNASTGLSGHVSMSLRCMLPVNLTQSVTAADVRRAQSLFGLFVAKYTATDDFNKVLLEQQI